MPNGSLIYLVKFIVQRGTDETSAKEKVDIANGSKAILTEAINSIVIG